MVIVGDTEKYLGMYKMLSPTLGPRLLYSLLHLRTCPPLLPELGTWLPRIETAFPSLLCSYVWPTVCEQM